MPHDYAAVTLLGLLILVLVYLTREVQRLREQLQPLTSSGAARFLSAT